MGLFETLDKFDKFIRRSSRLDWIIKPINPKRFNETLGHWRKISRNGDFDAVNGSHDRLIENYEQLRNSEIKLSELLPNVQMLLNDADIRTSFRKYAKHMDTKLLHSERLGLIFNNTVRRIPENHILELVKTMSRSEVVEIAAGIDESALTDVKKLVGGAFHGLAKRCPVQAKEEFMFAVDPMAYFRACMIAGGPGAQSGTYKEMLSELETPEALRFMKHSDTWQSIPKTPNLRDWLHDSDKRLLPALDYMK